MRACRLISLLCPWRRLISRGSSRPTLTFHPRPCLDSSALLPLVCVRLLLLRLVTVPHFPLAGRRICREGGTLGEEEPPSEVSEYASAMEKSWVFQELKAVRNFHGAFHSGIGPGLVHAGLISLVTKVRYRLRTRCCVHSGPRLRRRINRR